MSSRGLLRADSSSRSAHLGSPESRRRSNALTPNGIAAVGLGTLAESSETDDDDGSRVDGPSTTRRRGCCKCSAVLREFCATHAKIASFERWIAALLFWYTALAVAALADTSAFNAVYLIAAALTAPMMLHRKLLRRCRTACGVGAQMEGRSDAGGVVDADEVRRAAVSLRSASSRSELLAQDAEDAAPAAAVAQQQPKKCSTLWPGRRCENAGVVAVGLIALCFALTRLVYGTIVSQLAELSHLGWDEPCTRLYTRSYSDMIYAQLVMCGLGLTAFATPGGVVLWSAVAPVVGDILVFIAAVALSLSHTSDATFVGSFTQRVVANVQSNEVLANYVRDHGRILLTEDTKYAWATVTVALGGSSVYVALCIVLVLAGCAQPSVLCFPFFALSIGIMVHIIVGNFACSRKCNECAGEPLRICRDALVKSPDLLEAAATSEEASELALEDEEAAGQGEEEEGGSGGETKTAPPPPSSIHSRLQQAKRLREVSAAKAASRAAAARRPEATSAPVSAIEMRLMQARRLKQRARTMPVSPPNAANAAAVGTSEAEGGDDDDGSRVRAPSALEEDVMSTEIAAEQAVSVATVGQRCAYVVSIFCWTYSLIYFAVVWLMRNFLLESSLVDRISLKIGHNSNATLQSDYVFVWMWILVALVHILSSLSLAQQSEVAKYEEEEEEEEEDDEKADSAGSKKGRSPRNMRGSIAMMVSPHAHAVVDEISQWGECSGVFTGHTISEEEQTQLERTAQNLECTHDRGAGSVAPAVAEGMVLDGATVEQRLKRRSVQMYAWRWKRLQENFVKDLVWEMKHMEHSTLDRLLMRVHSFCTVAEHGSTGTNDSLWEEIVFFETSSVSITAKVVYDVMKKGNLSEQRTQVLRYLQSTLYKLFVSTIFLLLAFLRPSLLTSVYLLIVSVGLVPFLYKMLYGWRSMVVCLLYTSGVAFLQYSYAVGAAVVGQALGWEKLMGVKAQDAGCVYNSYTTLSWTTLDIPTPTPSVLATNATLADCMDPMFVHLRDAGLSPSFGSNSAYLSVLGVFVLCGLALLARISVDASAADGDGARCCRLRKKKDSPAAARLHFRCVMCGHDVLTWNSVLLQRYKFRRASVLLLTFLSGVFPTPSPLRFVFMVLFVFFCLPFIGAAISVVLWWLLELTCVVSVLAAYTWNFEVVASALESYATEWSLNRPSGSTLLVAMVLPSIALLLAEGSDRHIQSSILRRALWSRCARQTSVCKRKNPGGDVDGEIDDACAGAEAGADAEGRHEAEGEAVAGAEADAGAGMGAERNDIEHIDPASAIEDGGGAVTCFVFKSVCDYSLAVSGGQDSWDPEKMKKAFVTERNAALETETWMRGIAMRNVHNEVAVDFQRFIDVRRKEQASGQAAFSTPIGEINDEGPRRSRLIVALQNAHLEDKRTHENSGSTAQEEWDVIYWKLNLLRIFYHASVLARFPVTPLKSRFVNEQANVVTEKHLADLLNLGEEKMCAWQEHCTWQMFFDACEGTRYSKPSNDEDHESRGGSDEEDTEKERVTVNQMRIAFETLEERPVISVELDPEFQRRKKAGTFGSHWEEEQLNGRRERMWKRNNDKEERDDEIERQFKKGSKKLWLLDLEDLNFKEGQVNVDLSSDSSDFLYDRYTAVYWGLIRVASDARDVANEAAADAAKAVDQAIVELRTAERERGAIQMTSNYQGEETSASLSHRSRAQEMVARLWAPTAGSKFVRSSTALSAFDQRTRMSAVGALTTKESTTVFLTRLRDGREIPDVDTAALNPCNCTSHVKRWFDREMQDVANNTTTRSFWCSGGKCCSDHNHNRLRSLVIEQHLEVDLVFVRALEMTVLIVFVAVSFILAIVQAIGESFPALIWLLLVCFMLLLLVLFNSAGEEASPIRKSLKSIAHWNKWLAYVSGSFLLVSYATDWLPIRTAIDTFDGNYINPIVQRSGSSNTSLLLFTSTRGQHALVSDRLWQVGNHSFLFASASIFLYLFQLLGLRRSDLFDEDRDKEHLAMQSCGARAFGLVKNAGAQIVNFWSHLANVVCSTAVFSIALNDHVLSTAGAVYMFVALSWCVSPLVPARWLQCTRCGMTSLGHSLKQLNAGGDGGKKAPVCTRLCGWMLQCMRGSLFSAPVLGAIVAIVFAHGAYLLQFDWRLSYIQTINPSRIFTEHQIVQWFPRKAWVTNTTQFFNYTEFVNGSTVRVIKTNTSYASGSVVLTMAENSIETWDLAAPLVILCLAALLSLGRQVKISKNVVEEDVDDDGAALEGATKNASSSFVDKLFEFMTQSSKSSTEREQGQNVKNCLHMIEYHVLQLDDILCTLTWIREIATVVLLAAALTHISIISLVYLFVVVLLYHPFALGILGPSLKAHQWAPIAPIAASIFYQYWGLVLFNGSLSEEWASWLGLKQAGGRVSSLALDWTALLLLSLYMRMLPYLRRRYDGRTDINAVQTNVKEVHNDTNHLFGDFALDMNGFPTVKDVSDVFVDAIAKPQSVKFGVEKLWDFLARPHSRQAIQRRVPGQLYRDLQERRPGNGPTDHLRWQKRMDPVDLLIMRLLNHRRDEVGSSREFVKWKKRIVFDACKKWFRCKKKTPKGEEPTGEDGIDEHEQDEWMPHEEDFMKRCGTPQDIIAYCVFGLYPYLALFIVFILGTCNFNLMSLPYVALPLLVILAQPYGVFCGLDTSYARVAQIYYNPHYTAMSMRSGGAGGRWKKKEEVSSAWQCWRKWWSHSAFHWWYSLWMYSVFAIAFRIFMQMPAVVPTTRQAGFPVLLGLHPVYTFATTPDTETPAHNAIALTHSHLIAVDGAVFVLLLILNGVLSLKHVSVVLVANWRTMQDMAVRHRKLRTDVMEGQHQLLMRLSKHRTQNLKEKVGMFELTEAGGHSQHVKNFERQYLSNLVRSRKRAYETSLRDKLSEASSDDAERGCCEVLRSYLMWKVLQSWESGDVVIREITGGGILKLAEQLNSLHLVVFVVMIKIIFLNHTIVDTAVIVFMLFSFVLVSNPCGWQPCNPNFGANNETSADGSGGGESCRVAVSSRTGRTVISASGTLSSESKPSVQLWAMRGNHTAEGWAQDGYIPVASMSPKDRQQQARGELPGAGDELDDKNDDAMHVDHISAVSVSMTGNRAVSVGHDGLVIAYETAEQRKMDRDAEIEVITKFERHVYSMLLGILDIVPLWWQVEPSDDGGAPQRTALGPKEEDALWRTIALMSKSDEKTRIECNDEGDETRSALSWIQACETPTAPTTQKQRGVVYNIIVQNIDDRRRLRRALARCADEASELPRNRLTKRCGSSMTKVCATLLKNIHLDFEIGSGSRIFDPPFFRDLRNGPITTHRIDDAGAEEWTALVEIERRHRRRVEWYRGNTWRGHQFSTRDAERAARRATELEVFCEWSLITPPKFFTESKTEVALLTQDYCIDLRFTSSMESSVRSLFEASPPRWLQPRFQNAPVEGTPAAASRRLKVIAWFHGDRAWKDLHHDFLREEEGRATAYERRALALARVIFREGPRRRFYREHYMHAWVEIEVKHGINLIAPQLLAMTGTERVMRSTLQTQVEKWIHHARNNGIWSDLKRARNISRGGRHSGRAYARGRALNKLWLLDIFWESRDPQLASTQLDSTATAERNASYSATCSFRAVQERLQKHRTTLANVSKTLSGDEKLPTSSASSRVLSDDPIAPFKFERRTVRRLYDEQSQSTNPAKGDGGGHGGSSSERYSRSRAAQASLDIFDSVDKDGDEKLTVEELIAALTHFDTNQRSTVEALIKLADDGKLYGGDDTPTLTRDEFSVLIAFIDGITSTRLTLPTFSAAVNKINEGMSKYNPRALPRADPGPPKLKPSRSWNSNTAIRTQYCTGITQNEWLGVQQKISFGWSHTEPKSSPSRLLKGAAKFRNFDAFEIPEDDGGSGVYATYNDLVNLLMLRNHTPLSNTKSAAQRLKFLEDVAEKLMLGFGSVFALRLSDYPPDVRALVKDACHGATAEKVGAPLESALHAMDGAQGTQAPRRAYRENQHWKAIEYLLAGLKRKASRVLKPMNELTNIVDLLPVKKIQTPQTFFHTLDRRQDGENVVSEEWWDRLEKADRERNAKPFWASAQGGRSHHGFPLENVIEFLLPPRRTSSTQTEEGEHELQVVSAEQLSKIRQVHSLPQIGRTGLLRINANGGGGEYEELKELLKSIQSVGENLREIGNTALDGARVLQRLQKQQSGWIVAVAMTPDGRRIIFASDTGALYEHTFLFDSSGKHMHMYSEQEEKGRIPIALNCWQGAINAAGSAHGISRAARKSAKFETEPQKIIAQIKQRGSEVTEQRNLAITAIALTCNGRYVACGDRGGWLHVLHQRLDERRGAHNKHDLNGRWTHVGESQMHDSEGERIISMEQSTLQAVNAIAIMDCDPVKEMLEFDALTKSGIDAAAAADTSIVREAARGFIVISCGLNHTLVLWKVTPSVRAMGGAGTVERLCEKPVASELAVITIRSHPTEERFWTGHEVDMLMEWELSCIQDPLNPHSVSWEIQLLRCWPGAIQCQHFSCFDTCEQGLIVGGGQKNGHKFFAWKVAETKATNTGKARVVSSSVAPRESKADSLPGVARLKSESEGGESGKKRNVEQEFDDLLVKLFDDVSKRRGKEGHSKGGPSYADTMLLREMRTKRFRKPIVRRVLGHARRAGSGGSNGSGSGAGGAGGDGIDEKRIDTKPDLHVLWFLQQKIINDSHLVKAKDNAYNFRKMRNCFLGEKVVNWLVRSNGLNLDLDDAILVGNLLWQYGLIDLVDPTAVCHQWKKMTSTLTDKQIQKIDESAGDQMQTLQSSIEFESSCKEGLWFDDLDLESREGTVLVWPFDGPRAESKDSMLGISKSPFRSIGEGAYYTFVQLRLRKRFIDTKPEHGKKLHSDKWSKPRFPRIFPEVPHLHGLSDSHVIRRLTFLISEEHSVQESLKHALPDATSRQRRRQGLPTNDSEVKRTEPTTVRIARELKRLTVYAHKRRYLTPNHYDTTTTTGERAGALEDWLAHSDPTQWVDYGDSMEDIAAVSSSKSKRVETWRTLLRGLFEGIAERCGTRDFAGKGGKKREAEMKEARKIFLADIKKGSDDLREKLKGVRHFERRPCVLDLYLFASTVRLGAVVRDVGTHRGSNDETMRAPSREVCRVAALAMSNSLGTSDEDESEGITRMLCALDAAYEETDDDSDVDSDVVGRPIRSSEKDRMRAFCVEYFYTKCKVDPIDRDDVMIDAKFSIMTPWNMWWTLATHVKDDGEVHTLGTVHSVYRKVHLAYNDLFGNATPSTSFKSLVAVTVDDCQANRVQLEASVPWLVQLLHLFDPQVQNPPRVIWIALLLYSICMLLARFTWQLPIFCDCYGVPRLYPFCITSPHEAVSRQCAKSWYGNGDRSVYFNYEDQEFGANALLTGVKQAVDVSYCVFGLDKTPRNYYSDEDVGGTLTEATLKHGRSLEFVKSTIIMSDIMMIGALIFHIAALQRQGLWQMPSRHMGAGFEDTLSTVSSGVQSTSWFVNMWSKNFHRVRWVWKTWVLNVKWTVVPQRQRYGSDLFLWNQVFLIISCFGLLLQRFRPIGLLNVIQENSVDFSSLALVLLYVVFGMVDRVTYLLRNDVMKMLLHHVMVAVYVVQISIVIPVIDQVEKGDIQMNRHTLDTSTWVTTGDDKHPLAKIEKIDFTWGRLLNPVLVALRYVGLDSIFGNSVSDEGVIQIPTAAAKIYEMYALFAFPMFIYLCFSGLQVCYGYPRLPNKSFLMEERFRTMLASRFWLVWRSIPLRYELLGFIDWAFTDTTLFISEWFMFQDIYSQLYVSACVYQAVMEIPRVKGDRQPGWKKLFCGVVPAASVLVALVAPLVMYSNLSAGFGLGTAAETYQEVKYVEVELSIPGYSPLYRTTATAQRFVQTDNEASYYLRPEDAQELSTRTFSYLNDASGATEAQNIAWKARMASFTASPYSDQMWESSPEMIDTLATRLSLNLANDLQMVYTFTSSTVTGGTASAAASSSTYVTKKMIQPMQMTTEQTSSLARIVRNCSMGVYNPGWIALSGRLFPRTVYLPDVGDSTSTDTLVKSPVKFNERTGINTDPSDSTTPAFDMCNVTCHGIPLFENRVVNVTGSTAGGQVTLPLSSSSGQMRWDLQCRSSQQKVSLGALSLLLSSYFSLLTTLSRSSLTHMRRTPSPPCSLFSLSLTHTGASNLPHDPGRVCRDATPDKDNWVHRHRRAVLCRPPPLCSLTPRNVLRQGKAGALLYVVSDGIFAHDL